MISPFSCIFKEIKKFFLVILSSFVKQRISFMFSTLSSNLKIKEKMSSETNKFLYTVYLLVITQNNNFEFL